VLGHGVAGAAQALYELVRPKRARETAKAAGVRKSALVDVCNAGRKLVARRCDRSDCASAHRSRVFEQVAAASRKLRRPKPVSITKSRSRPRTCHTLQRAKRVDVRLGQQADAVRKGLAANHSCAIGSDIASRDAVLPRARGQVRWRIVAAMKRKPCQLTLEALP